MIASNLVCGHTQFLIFRIHQLCLKTNSIAHINEWLYENFWVGNIHPPPPPPTFMLDLNDLLIRSHQINNRWYTKTFYLHKENYSHGNGWIQTSTIYAHKRLVSLKPLKYEVLWKFFFIYHII